MHTSGAETQGGGTVERTSTLSKLRCVTCSTPRRILAALAQWPWRHIVLWPRQLRGRSTREPIAITKRAAGAVIQTISRCTLSNSIGGAWRGPQLGRSGACSAQLANKVFSSSMCACRRHFFSASLHSSGHTWRGASWSVVGGCMHEKPMQRAARQRRPAQPSRHLRACSSHRPTCLGRARAPVGATARGDTRSEFARRPSVESPSRAHGRCPCTRPCSIAPHS